MFSSSSAMVLGREVTGAKAGDLSGEWWEEWGVHRAGSGVKFR